MNSHFPLADKRVLVMGLGRFGGGVGVSRWLAEQGARVTVTDTANAEQLAESVQKLADLGDRITFKLGGHDLADFTACDLLITNPAVDKAKSEFVQAALRAGIPCTSEMNLFLERCRGFTIGVTGSVGKSTTTTLIFEAIKAGLNVQPESNRVFLGGNIGKSLLAELPNIRPQDLIVLELSSFMLEETAHLQWSPNIAVVTNLFPNHLDRHHTMAEYAAIKQNILKFQKPADVAILNNDHDLISRWVHLARGKVIKYTTRGPSTLNLLMPGEHNQSNARAALAALDHLPVAVDRAAAMRAIENFGGLAHRLQIVHATQLAIPGEAPRTLRFYNDSKATSPDASITALKAFAPGAAIFIVGGYDKHIDLSAFEKLLAQRAGGVIGIGQTGQAMVDQVKTAGVQCAGARIAYAQTLQQAMPLAVQWARAVAGDAGSTGEGDRPALIEAIVLSPASASWDQYPNYEARGDLFASLARAGG